MKLDIREGTGTQIWGGGGTDVRLEISTTTR